MLTSPVRDSALALGVGAISLAFIGSNVAWCVTTLLACIALLASLLLFALPAGHKPQKPFYAAELVSLAISILLVLVIQGVVFATDADISMVDDPAYAANYFYRQGEVAVLITCLILCLLVIRVRSLIFMRVKLFAKPAGCRNYLLTGLLILSLAMLCEQFFKINELIFQDIFLCSIVAIFWGVIGLLIRLSGNVVLLSKR